MSLEGFVVPDMSIAPDSTVHAWSSQEGPGWSAKTASPQYPQQMGHWQQTSPKDEVTQLANMWPNDPTMQQSPTTPSHVHPQYWQHGVVPQYGVVPMQFDASVPQTQFWTRRPESQQQFGYPPVQHQSTWPARQCILPVQNPNWHHPLAGGNNMFQCISSDRKQGHQCNGNRENNQPRVHITITPAQNRIVKKTKRKRVRTAFTTDQILALEEVFSKQTYVSRNERQVLTETLKISDRAIKVWFQNRRMKGKREHQAAFEDSDEYEQNTLEQPDSSLGPSCSGDSNGSISSPITNLDYVESQIQKTDEFGYVTLDDKSWGALFNVIDAYVPENIEVTSSGVKEEFPKVKDDVIYEPISPADTNSSAAEDIESYKPPKDEEALNHLFNIHFC